MNSFSAFAEGSAAEDASEGDAVRMDDGEFRVLSIVLIDKSSEVQKAAKRRIPANGLARFVIVQGIDLFPF
ncbi:hypothetical protein AGMMS50256_01870 [Betaproteobacteria bacterium]|nr:hypothetical protein AGMMS50256_01870 [Betaproteobacteria bacterium]